MTLSERQGGDFRALWLGQSVNQMGDRVSAFVLPVLVLSASSGRVRLLIAVAAIGYPCLACSQGSSRTGSAGARS